MNQVLEELRQDLVASLQRAQGEYAAAELHVFEAKHEVTVCEAALKAHDNVVSAVGAKPVLLAGAGATTPTNGATGLRKRAPRRDMQAEIVSLLGSSASALTAKEIVDKLTGLRLNGCNAALARLLKDGKVTERDDRWTLK